MPLNGKVALVSGGHRGIGEAIVRRFAIEGAHVGLADIEVEAGEILAEKLIAAGLSVQFIKLDVTKQNDWETAVNTLMEQHGRLDILVNNAGVYQRKPMHETSEDDWDLIMEVNSKGVFLGCKAALEPMKRSGGGSIVNISSVHGFLVAKKALTYETGKAAVIAMTKQMAVDYGPNAIRLNAICPGHIVTERIMENVWKNNPSGLKFFEDQYPVRRTGIPEDIGNAAAFLCSDEASFITGHALPVDGGLTIQLQENFGVQQVHYYMDNLDTQMPYKR